MERIEKKGRLTLKGNRYTAVFDAKLEHSSGDRPGEEHTPDDYTWKGKGTVIDNKTKRRRAFDFSSITEFRPEPLHEAVLCFKSECLSGWTHKGKVDGNSVKLIDGRQTVDALSEGIIKKITTADFKKVGCRTHIELEPLEIEPLLDLGLVETDAKTAFGLHCRKKASITSITTNISVPRGAIPLKNGRPIHEPSESSPDILEILVKTEVDDEGARTNVTGGCWDHGAEESFELNHLLNDKRILTTYSGFSSQEQEAHGPAMNDHRSIVDRIMLTVNEGRKMYLEKICGSKKTSVIKSVIGSKQGLKEREKDWE